MTCLIGTVTGDPKDSLSAQKGVMGQHHYKKRFRGSLGIWKSVWKGQERPAVQEGMWQMTPPEVPTLPHRINFNLPSTRWLTSISVTASTTLLRNCLAVSSSPCLQDKDYILFIFDSVVFCVVSETKQTLNRYSTEPKSRQSEDDIMSAKEMAETAATRNPGRWGRIQGRGILGGMIRANTY